MQLAIKKYVPNPGAAEKSVDVVLIHGTGACADMWNPQIKLLQERGYRCFLPDLRGHGDSHEPHEDTDMEAHINDVLQTLRDSDIRFPAVFAGHSLGAILSLVIAERHPELFKKILAVAMPGRVPAATVHAFRWFLGWPYKSIKDAQIHKNFAWRERVLMETHHHTLTQIATNFAKIDYIENIPRVVCPVHFAVGILDPVAPVVHVKKMHTLMPNSTLQVFDWAGHNCMDSQPAAFNKWFLDKLDG